MPRGGKRQGTPGKAYGNRSDLNQPVRVPNGGEYGTRQAKEQAQRQMPLPQAPPVPTVPLGAPTQMPGQPVTAGLPIGAGQGPTAAPQPDPMDVLAELYRRDPNEDLRHLLALQDQMKRMGPEFTYPGRGGDADLRRRFGVSEPGDPAVNDGNDGSWSMSARGPTTDLFDENGRPLVDRMPGMGAGRMVEPNHPGGEDHPIPGHMPSAQHSGTTAA